MSPSTPISTMEGNLNSLVPMQNSTLDEFKNLIQQEIESNLKGENKKTSTTTIGASPGSAFSYCFQWFITFSYCSIYYPSMLLKFIILRLLYFIWAKPWKIKKLSFLINKLMKKHEKGEIQCHKCFIALKMSPILSTLQHIYREKHLILRKKMKLAIKTKVVELLLMKIGINYKLSSKKRVLANPRILKKVPSAIRLLLKKWLQLKERLFLHHLCLCFLLLHLFFHQIIEYQDHQTTKKRSN